MLQRTETHIDVPSVPPFEEGTPDISVVVVNWNRSNLLKNSLKSLELQTGVSFEVIVVDNASDDDSVDMLLGMKKSVRYSLRIVENKTNTGFCAGNNRGIALARGGWIALLNNDAEAEPQWLRSMWSAVKAKPEFGMVASKILLYEDPRKIDKTGHLIYPDGQNRGRGTGEWDNGQYETQEEVLWPDGCAALYRKAMLDEIGGFDEDLFAYGDDAELGLRARIAGWRCLYVPEAVVRHHHSSTLGSLSTRRLELIERNRILLAVKHFPMRLLWLNGVWFSLRIAAGAWAALRGKGEAGRFVGSAGKVAIAVALLRGMFAALLMIPETMRKRRSLRHIRRMNSKEIQNLVFAHKISLKTLSETAL